MRRNHIVRIASVVCGLAIAAPAFAAETTAFETRCFEVKLPKSFELLKKTGGNLFQGRWAYGSKALGARIVFSCRKLTPGSIESAFKSTIGAAMKAANVKDWKASDKPSTNKDEDGNPIMSLVGAGKIDHPGPKPNTVLTTPYVIARILSQFKAVGLQASVLVMVEGAKAKDGTVQKLLGAIAETFEPLDKKELEKLKKLEVKKN